MLDDLATMIILLSILHDVTLLLSKGQLSVIINRQTIAPCIWVKSDARSIFGLNFQKSGFTTKIHLEPWGLFWGVSNYMYFKETISVGQVSNEGQMYRPQYGVFLLTFEPEQCKVYI